MRRSVPSWAKGGGRHGGWDGRHRGGLLLQRDDYSRHVGLRDAEPLGEGGQRAGGGIAEGTQRGQQRREEDMNPLEFIPLSFWYDAPLTSQDRDRRHDPWLVYRRGARPPSNIS